jgi:hypothetical protein
MQRPNLMKTTMIVSSITGMLVGMSILRHGGAVEIALAISVITGHLGALMGSHEHDKNHVVVHRKFER